MLIDSTDRVEEMIVTVTPNPSVDISTAVDVVEPDRKLRCDEPKREAGGGGLNVARASVAAGTAAVMTPGTELCRSEDVERLFSRMR